MVAETFEPENESAPSCKCKMLMPVQNCNLATILQFCLFFRLDIWHCNECHQITPSKIRILARLQPKILKPKLKFDCLFSECNRQSEVIRLLEEYQNSSSTGSEEAYYDDYETEDPNCTCDSGHTHEHQVSIIWNSLVNWLKKLSKTSLKKSSKNFVKKFVNKFIKK